MSRYQELGIRPVINAYATLTRLGGSLMPPEAVKAMQDGAAAFIDYPELHDKVGQRLAELTHNEACFVSSGAAAGIVAAVASCISGTDKEKAKAFPYLEGIQRTEVIIPHSQRNGYDYAARQTGARIVEVGPTADDLRAKITDKTACVLWFAGGRYEPNNVPIADAVKIAHERGVPFLVDAAAQFPPASNLWRFTRDLGADAVIFSGGKGLRGPQSSGLVLGKREIIEGCRINGSPNASIGRPMKVGKEEMLGLLAAVEWSLAQNEEEVLAGYEASVQKWIQGVAGIPGVTAERGYPSEAGQPHGRAVIHFGPESRLSRDDVVKALWDQNPRVAVSPLGDDAIALNPQTLQPGEDDLVLAALKSVLEQAPAHAGS